MKNCYIKYLNIFQKIKLAFEITTGTNPIKDGNITESFHECNFKRILKCLHEIRGRMQKRLLKTILFVFRFRLD